jgi:uncharacterized protein (TIGR00369 family)
MTATTSADAIIRQRAYAWEDPAATRAAAASQDGLTVLRAIGTGELPMPPALRTLGIEPVEAEPGRVTFALDPAEFHLNPFGLVHGGVLAAMLDTAMGCAVHSLLPAATGYVTGEMNTRFLRPATLSTGPLACTGQVVHAGTSTMVAEARVIDGQGHVIAIAGTTCVVRRPR